jgi:hypothetical protein
MVGKSKRGWKRRMMMFMMIIVIVITKGMMTKGALP